jgi:hypothetical protein
MFCFVDYLDVLIAQSSQLIQPPYESAARNRSPELGRLNRRGEGLKLPKAGI